MHPEQIKAAIRMTGITPAVLADELGVSRSTVSHVITGRGTSARVKARIAQVTGLSVATLWPKPDGTKLRRPAPTPAQKEVTSERRDQARREHERREQSRRDGERRMGAPA